MADVDHSQFLLADSQPTVDAGDGDIDFCGLNPTVDLPGRVPPSPGSLDDMSCECLISAIEAYQDMELSLWSQSQPVYDSKKTIQYQKRSIAVCEQFAACSNCNSLPACLMLILSVVSKISRSIELMTPLNGTDRVTRSSRTSSRHLDKGRWQDLDDDDQSTIMASLLQARKARLAELLRTMQVVMSKVELPVHQARLQQICDYCSLRLKTG